MQALPPITRMQPMRLLPSNSENTIVNINPPLARPETEAEENNRSDSGRNSISTVFWDGEDNHTLAEELEPPLSDNDNSVYSVSEDDEDSQTITEELAQAQPLSYKETGALIAMAMPVAMLIELFIEPEFNIPNSLYIWMLISGAAIVCQSVDLVNCSDRGWRSPDQLTGARSEQRRAVVVFGAA